MKSDRTACSSRRRLCLAGAASLALLPLARAQSPGIRRIGWLGWVGATGASSSAQALASFRGGLADRGWKEDRDLVVHVREGDSARSAEMASEMSRLGAEILVAQGPTVFGAKSVAGATPVIFCINGDPVEAGLVASMSRPGRTLTGVTALSAELAGKRVELLKAAMQKGSRLAVVANDRHPGVAIEREATHAAAKRLGLSVTWHGLKAAGELPAALAAIAREGTDALLAIPDNLINIEARTIAAFTAAQRIPSISGWSEFAEAGNLMSYGPNHRGYYRQMADLADRILRGAKAADVAVEQPRELEMVVNARAARSIGLTLPPELQFRADRRID